MNKSLSFIFNGYESNLEKGEIFFHFGFKGERNIDFTEKISFPPVTNKIPEALLKSLLDNLMLILGISYWKLYCPKNLVLESVSLTKEQAEFWNTIYTKGMGEFFYKNKIDFRGLVNFSSAKKNSGEGIATSFPRRNRSLLGIGGGKDSIVAAEMLREQNQEFGIMIDDQEIKTAVSRAIGKEPIIFKRELDTKLFKLNKEKGVYNGHIPISAIYAFLGTLACELYDYNELIVGNEKSANYGNIRYLGEMINHQWSKSEEFEKLFNNYVKKFITLDITYYSPLRNMTELQVVGEFVKYPKYFRTFSSCNRNFKILNSSKGTSLRGGGAVQDDKGLWCGECAKCLFVFICLAAFLPENKVLAIFGKNLFENQSLIPLFEELIGIRNFKPFECVGMPEEIKEALNKIVEKKEFNNTILIKYFKIL